MRSEVLTSGEVIMSGLESLRYFCTPTTQQFVRPDYFDHCGMWHRLIPIDHTSVAITVSPQGCIRWYCTEALEDTKVYDALRHLFLPLPLLEEATNHLPAELQAHLLSLHPLVHVASSSLGEALIKAIIRQVITANHAKKLLDFFIRRYGEQRTYQGAIFYDFPSLETIAALPLEDLQACGLGFKAKVVRNTAMSILEQGLEEKVRRVPREEALCFLQSIKGIGRWSAHVTICDLFGAWQFYPFEDLAVRTWARKLWPQESWPTDERTFSAKWQALHGTNVGVITFYLLSYALTQPSL